MKQKMTEKMADLTDNHWLNIRMNGPDISMAKIKSLKFDDTDNWQAFDALKYYDVFYINFHSIKDEISTQRASWGNLKSFLAKHIKKLVDTDSVMQAKKNNFEKETKEATDKVLNDSDLTKFVATIKKIIR